MNAATAATLAAWKLSLPTPLLNDDVESVKAGLPEPRAAGRLHHQTICKAANKGDSLASEVIEYVGRHLGKTIAIAINLFNPQKIVIAGEITEADKVLLPCY
ncbi:ROK family protein [Escherichia coli]